jgi:glycosyltransferase involved in cell wall biosynthesis
MRVLRLLPELDFGGVESRLEVQARLHDRSAYRLSVCGFHKPGRAAAALRELDVPVDVLGVSPSPRNPKATLALARFLRRHRPDIVHASIAEANLHSLLAAPFSGVPVFIAEETGMPNHSALARRVYRVAYRAADAVVGVTAAVCDYVRRVDRAPEDRVRLIYNCAGPAYFPVARWQPPPTSRPLTLLLVGRLVPVKSHLFFLRALRQVLPAASGAIRVLIAGEGPLRGQLEAEIQALGLTEVVQLLGLRQDVRGLLAEADVFALPSLSEGCSVSLIEAMATHVHVIGSDVPGIREVMGPLASDWTAPPEDGPAWTELLRRALALSPSDRRELARRAQDRAYELFSPQAYVTRLQDLYNELLNGSQRSPVASRAR